MMWTENLIALMLPVAAMSGWYAAKKHFTRKHIHGNGHSLTQAYRRGLNYLLNENTDEAISAVIRILEEDSEPLSTRIALGNLFRRRGEVDKAIEVHKKLINESSLSDADRQIASYELGLDYTRAGLLDRAEEIFESLSRTSTHVSIARQQLLYIYQQQKDWHKAIECVSRLRLAAKPKHGETVAHFLCELAEEAMRDHRLKDARDYLGKALADEPNSIRANITKGKLELGNGEYHQALQTFKVIEQQNAVYLPVVLPLMITCWERQGAVRELINNLDQLYRNFGIISAAIECAERLKNLYGCNHAIEYLIPILETNPDPMAISRSLVILTEDASLDSMNLRILCNLLRMVMEVKQQFLCAQCGFATSALHWRCPSCQNWGSITPVGAFSVLMAQDEETGISGATTDLQIHFEV